MTVSPRVRVLLCVTAATVAIAPSAGAASRRTVTYYLDVFGGCAGQAYAVSRVASGSVECAQLPRALVQGKGVTATDPDFSLSRKDVQPAARIDASRTLDGTFYVVVPGPNPTSPDLASYVAADYSVRIDRVTVGTVHVEGATSAAGPAKATFSLRIPASLNGKPLTAITITPTWITCVAPCATGVSGARHSTFVVPLR
jgi:hypothetical protein